MTNPRRMPTETATVDDVASYANDILKRIDPGKFEEAINWADLSCIDVAVTTDGETWVTISECSPNCVELPNFLTSELRKEFEGGNFFVICEW